MELDILVRIYEDILKRIEKSHNSTPQGSLRISYSHGKPRFYLVSDRKNPNGQYLRISDSEDSPLIKSLCQKKYDLKVKRAIDTDLKVLKEAMRIDRSNTIIQVFNNLRSEKQKYVSPYIKTEEQYSHFWKSETYIHKKLKEDESFYLTNDGNRVRSKSEYIIANKLFSLDIPYRYEMRYEMNFQNSSKVIVYPDFTVLNKRTRTVYIYEHFGMLDNSDYLNNAVDKIELYTKNGFILGKTFIFTCETSKHSLNIENLDNIIKTFFL